MPRIRTYQGASARRMKRNHGSALAAHQRASGIALLLEDGEAVGVQLHALLHLQRLAGAARRGAAGTPGACDECVPPGA